MYVEMDIIIIIQTCIHSYSHSKVAVSSCVVCQLCNSTFLTFDLYLTYVVIVQ